MTCRDHIQTIDLHAGEDGGLNCSKLPMACLGSGRTLSQRDSSPAFGNRRPNSPIPVLVPRTSLVFWTCQVCGEEGSRGASKIECTSDVVHPFEVVECC